MSANHWIKQAYLAWIPAFPMGYLIVHGFRGDQIWTRPYIDRSVIPPSEQLHELLESELDKLHTLKHPKVLLSLTEETEPKCYGGFFLSPGAEIQLPIRLSFIDVEHARRLGTAMELDMGLAKHRRKLETSSAVGEELLSRMMLSEVAKRFLIQRQLQIANNGTFFCVPILVWAGVFSAGYALLCGMISVAGPYIAFIGASAGSLMLFKQFLAGFEEFKTRKADELTVTRDPMYIVGARDYLETGLRLNRLQRRILGEEGERTFNKNGDSKLERVPYSARLKLLDHLEKTQPDIKKKTVEKGKGDVDDSMDD